MVDSSQPSAGKCVCLCVFVCVCAHTCVYDCVSMHTCEMPLEEGFTQWKIKWQADFTVDINERFHFI